MNQSEKEAILDKMGELALALREDVSTAQLLSLLDMLADLSAPSILYALAQWGRTGRRFPKPAEIRELCEGSHDDHAVLAWSALQKATAYGDWPSIFCEDRTLAQAIIDTFGGWIPCASFLNSCEPQMEASKRNDFFRNYRVATRAPRDIASYCVGKFEVDNTNNISLWRERYRGNGIEEIPLMVVRIGAGGNVSRVFLPWSLETGSLTTPALKQLETNTAPRLILRSAPERLALPAAQVEVHPAAIRQDLIKVSRKMLLPEAVPLTEAEYLARRRKLQAQAAEISR